jgi:hypothetical protein
MSWEIYGTDEFFEWFASLAKEGMEEVDYKVRLLEEFGPNLKRPHADTLKGSKINNLKELRAKTSENIYRITFLFDEERDGIVIIGGDKKGVNQKKFYKDLIKESETLIEKYHDYEWEKENKWEKN